MANKKITRQLSIYINGKQVKNNLFSIGKEVGKLRGQMKHLTRGTKEYKEKSAELKKVTKVWNDMQKEIKGVPSLLSKVRKELGLVGLTIVSVFSINGMINYFKVLHQKVDLLRELKHTILQITELEGRELELVTSKVKALADTFESDAKKMTESANVLSKQMGIDFTKALDLIEKGFLDGANANGDFLDKVREYPALLKEAGLSAKQSIALMSQEVKKGIYSDKGVDAIKEANLRLREMTPAAAQAIKAIGLSSVEIEKDLTSGKKTIFKVIQDISQRLSLIPSKSKLAGQAVADIFGGAGEDAGFEYLSTLHEIDLSLSDATVKTDKYAEAKKLEVEANEALNNVWVQLTDTASTLHLMWNKLKMQGALVLSFFAQLVGLSDDADGSMYQLRNRIATVIKIVVIAATAFFSYKASLRLMTLWTKIATGDTILHTLAIKANAIGLIFAKGAVFAYKAVIALLSGNLKKATIAMRAFSIATKLSPIGLLVGLITAVTVAYVLFSKKVDEAAVKQQALNDLKKRAASIYGQEEGALKKLLIVAKDEKLNKEQRQKAIQQIIKSYPEYLGNLTLENINTTQVAEAIDLQIVVMKKRAEQKALEQLIDETIKKRREEEAKGLEDHTKWYDYLTSSVKSFGNQAMFSTNMAITASKRKIEAIKVLSDKENTYTEEYKKRLRDQSKADAKRLESDKKFKRIRASLEKTASQFRIKNIENLTNEQLRIEIGKAIERNNKLAGIRKKAADKAISEEKNATEARIKSINKAEIALDALLIEIQLKRELKSKTGLEKELLAIDNKYSKLKEKFVLNKQEESLLSIEELKIHNAKITELETTQTTEREDLKILRAAEFKERVKIIEEENRIEEEAQKYDKDALAAATEEERVVILLKKARWIATEELKIERDKDLAKLKGLTGFEKLKDAIRQKYLLKQGKVDAVFEESKKAFKKEEVKFVDMTEQQKFGLIKQGLGQAADAFNKGSAGWKAMKISEAIMSTYEGAQSAFTSLSKIPFIGVPLGIAAAIAATKAGLSRVSQIKNTKTAQIAKGNYVGGHTGDKAIYHDGQDGVTGPVHVGEWVAPKWMNENPRYAQTIQYLETERIKGPGNFDGGHASTSPPPSFETADTTEVSDTDSSILLEQLTRLNNHLDNGIMAYALIGDDKIQNLKEREEKLNNSRENAKIQ